MPVVDILKLTQILQNITKAKSLMCVQILDPSFINRINPLAIYDN